MSRSACREVLVGIGLFGGGVAGVVGGRQRRLINSGLDVAGQNDAAPEIDRRADGGHDRNDRQSKGQ